MAIHKLPTLELYWCPDPDLSIKVDSIASVVTRNRFLKITSILHLNDNFPHFPKVDPKHDKLHRVRPVVEALNESIKAVYKLSNLSAIHKLMIEIYAGKSEN